MRWQLDEKKIMGKCQGSDGLWEDHLQNLTYKRKAEGTPPNIRPGFGEVVVRTVPKQMAEACLVDRALRIRGEHLKQI